MQATGDHSNLKQVLCLTVWEYTFFHGNQWLPGGRCVFGALAIDFPATAMKHIFPLMTGGCHVVC